MHLLEVEHWVGIGGCNAWDLVDDIGLVLEDVFNFNILAQVGQKVRTSVNMNTEVDIFAEELLWLHDFELFVGLTVTSAVTRPVGDLQLASDTAWGVSGHRHNVELRFDLSSV